MRVCLVGETSVGKTTICHNIVGINRIPSATIGLEFYSTKYKGQKINFWDTAGQERYRALLPMYLRKAKTIIYVISALNLTKENYSYWLDYIEKNADDNYNIIIVVTKCDLAKNYKKDLVFLKEYLPNVDIVFRFNDNISNQLLEIIYQLNINPLEETNNYDNFDENDHYISLSGGESNENYLNNRPSCC